MGRVTRTGARRCASAFTLLELLLVIMLIALIAGFTWPLLFGVLSAEQITESSSRLRSAIAMSRAEAMNNAARYGLMIRQDGTVRLLRQADALNTPDKLELVRAPWAMRTLLLDDVWVAAVQELPEGPPPMEVVDELVELEDYLDEPPPISQLERPLMLMFDPDGTSNSARWDLRDAAGRGVRMTLDGRLGRVSMETLERLDPGAVRRPVLLGPDELDDEDQAARERASG